MPGEPIPGDGEFVRGGDAGRSPGKRLLPRSHYHAFDQQKRHDEDISADEILNGDFSSCQDWKRSATMLCGFLKGLGRPARV